MTLPRLCIVHKKDLGQVFVTGGVSILCNTHIHSFLYRTSEDTRIQWQNSETSTYFRGVLGSAISANPTVEVRNTPVTKACPGDHFSVNSEVRGLGQGHLAPVSVALLLCHVRYYLFTELVA
jgi:hypothetical protein